MHSIVFLLFLRKVNAYGASTAQPYLLFRFQPFLSVNLSNSRRGKYFFSVCYCICIAKCVLFLFCVVFPLSAAVLIRALLTDWSSVSLWASFSAYALFSFSLSDTIKQKHISKPSERGIFLSFLILHSALSFVSTAWFDFFFPSSSDRFVLCSSPHSFPVLCCTILCKFELDLENVKIVTSLWGILQQFYPQMILCVPEKNCCPQSVPEHQIAAMFCLLSRYYTCAHVTFFHFTTSTPCLVHF